MSKILKHIIFLSFLLTACKSTNAIDQNVKLQRGDDLAILDGVGFDFDHAIFDDFTNGVDYNRWIIASGAWGDYNGGVIADNVQYTEDGVLILTGRGSHYAKEEVRGVGQLKDGRKTGAAIVSKFTTGPGHYEVRMKPLPRRGACSAFWTYVNFPNPENEQNNINHEIDIEMPGGIIGESKIVTFKNVLNTNYTYVKLKDSQDVVVSEALHDKVTYLNDGKFHNFGFEWYTNPGCVIYFIDGVITNVSTELEVIPSLETRIWLGNWFPESLVGSADFELDYMAVDWFKYIPFDSTQPYERIDVPITVNSALEIQYPKKPISFPEINQVSNGDFEYINIKNEQKGYGWDFKKLPGVSEVVENLVYVSKDGSFDNSSCGVIKAGGQLSTNIDSVYEGFTYDLSLDYISMGEDAILEIRYMDSADSLIEREIIPLNSEDWAHTTKRIVAPYNNHSITLRIYSQNKVSDVKIDNLKMERIYGEY